MSKPDNNEIIYSSLKEVLRVGTDSEMPGYPSSMGIVIRQGRFGGYHLTYHEPKLCSMVHGEAIECEPEEIDAHLKETFSLYAQYCRQLSNDLLTHAERLDAEAEKEKLVVTPRADLPQMEETRSHSGDYPGTYSTTSIHSSGKNHAKSSPKPSSDLSMFR